MNTCATCGHDSDRHWAYGRGPCGFRILNEDDSEWRCPCERFAPMELRSLGRLIGLRILTILFFVARRTHMNYWCMNTVTFETRFSDVPLPAPWISVPVDNDDQAVNDAEAA